MTAELKPIRGEQDHEAALAEVELLWGARSGTPDGDRLDILATLFVPPDCGRAAYLPSRTSTAARSPAIRPSPSAVSSPLPDA